MDLDSAIHHARAGRSLVFLGAGFSVGAKNLRDSEMKTGKQFAASLAVKSNLPKDANLADASEVFRSVFGDDALVKEIVDEFTTVEPLPHQISLAAIPWKTVYTTNYDDVFERAGEQNGVSYQLIKPNMLPEDVLSGSIPCIHLNGSIHGLNKSMLNGEFKLTDSSYVSGTISNLSWVSRLRQDLAVAQSVFFIGYSTYDLDIARLLFDFENLKEKSFFVTGAAADPITKLRIAKFGANTGLSAKAFAEIASDAKFETAVDVRPISFCIENFEEASSAQESTDQDAYELFLFGLLKQPLVAASLFSRADYTVPRDACLRMRDRLKGGTKTICLFGGLGSGKTLALEMLKHYMRADGWTVFSPVRRGPSLLEELDFSLRQEGSLLCIIDNYASWVDLLEFIGQHKRDNLSVVLAARTVTHEAFENRAQISLRVEGFEEVRVDRLPSSDLVLVRDLMDRLGFWGERANLNAEAKTAFLAKECHGSWSDILLSIFKAPQIASRLQTIVDDISGESRFQNVFTTILVLSIIDFPADLATVIDLCGEITLTSDFRKSPAVRELIDFQHDEVKLRSATTGAFLLKELANPNVTLQGLVNLCRNADEMASSENSYNAILESVMRFGNAQNFFPKNDRFQAVMKFYEQIRTLHLPARNPLFWLQYAIAAMNADEYGRAGKYFESAYSYAKEIRFNTYQIDNHYAKFLLLDSIRKNDPTDIMKVFRKARKLIIEQVTREERQHPYRAADVISDWFEAYGHRLNTADQDEVRRAAAFIVARAMRLPERVQQQRDIQACVKRLRPIAQGAV